MKRLLVCLTGFPLPDGGNPVTVRAVDSRMAVENVVCDVKSATGIPLGKLRAIGVVTNRLIGLVEFDSKILDEFVPEPFDTGVRLVGKPRATTGNEFLVIGDIVGLMNLETLVDSMSAGVGLWTTASVDGVLGMQAGAVGAT